MVIVHLSINSRRIISPGKNETLDHLFKRFCQEYSYRESEYEFQSYPEDTRVPLDLNMNANRVKEVSLVHKRVSRRNSEESCYTVIRDASPVVIENRKKIAVSVPATKSPNEIAVSDNINPKKQPKRNAPKAPVINDRINDDKTESKIPDFDIPPPPEFMPPHEEATEKERYYYKSVECGTDNNLSRETSSSGSVAEEAAEICHSSGDINEDSNNDDYDEDPVLNVNLQVTNEQNESESESSVEDVYDDEELLGNRRCQERLEGNNQTFGEKADDVKSDEDCECSDEEIIESIEIVINESEECEEWKQPDHVSLNESVQLNCPIAEMEETDIRSINSSNNEYLSDSDDQIESSVDNEEENVINSTPIDQKDSKLNYEDPFSLGEKNKTNLESIDELPKPKIRVKPIDKSRTSSLDSGEVLELSKSKSEGLLETAGETPCGGEDLSTEDGHPTDFPITMISEPSNPRFFWELPKQGKTFQIMSRTLNTDVIPEPKVVQKIEQSKAPSTAPKPTKAVKVVVQESPSEPSGGPMYRKPQPKTLIFTAAPTNVTK